MASRLPVYERLPTLIPFATRSVTTLQDSVWLPSSTYTMKVEQCKLALKVSKRRQQLAARTFEFMGQSMECSTQGALRVKVSTPSGSSATISSGSLRGRSPMASTSQSHLRFSGTRAIKRSRKTKRVQPLKVHHPSRKAITLL